ncbi:MAG: NADH-quinone oxidoreductase subunit M, partial [Microthrixaceae bacterium]
MTEFLNDWGLVLVTFLPLAGALVMLLVPKESEGAIKALALGTSLAAAVMGLLLMIDFDYGRAGELQFEVDTAWIDLINARFIMGLDGLSL